MGGNIVKIIIRIHICLENKGFLLSWKLYKTPMYFNIAGIPFYHFSLGYFDYITDITCDT